MNIENKYDKILNTLHCRSKDILEGTVILKHQTVNDLITIVPELSSQMDAMFIAKRVKEQKKSLIADQKMIEESITNFVQGWSNEVALPLWFQNKVWESKKQIFDNRGRMNQVELWETSLFTLKEYVEAILHTSAMVHFELYRTKSRESIGNRNFKILN